MTEGPRGGQDSRPAENPRPDDGTPAVPAPHGDVYTWYQRGLELLGQRRMICWERRYECGRTDILPLPLGEGVWGGGRWGWP